MSTPASSEPLRDRLLAAAQEAMSHAYAPYSKFQVGAALITEDGEVFTGCNVENASYGLTNCAERTAIFTAINTSGTKIRIRAIAVANSANMACAPCGACRQVIAEFGPNATVWYQGADGICEKSMRDLLPDGFSF
jgi:cytidine deaminase